MLNPSTSRASRTSAAALSVRPGTMPATVGVSVRARPRHYPAIRFEDAASGSGSTALHARPFACRRYSRNILSHRTPGGLNVAHQGLRNPPPGWGDTWQEPGEAQGEPDARYDL